MDQWVAVSDTGVSFCVEIHGKQPSLIFAHGFSESKRSWEYLWQDLTQDYAAMRYDLRGFGKTICNNSDLFSHSTDLKSLLETLNIQRCVLIGISMGGGAALKTALDYPELVSHLVLFCPAIDGWQWSDEWRKGWRDVCELARSGNVEKAKQFWWQYPLFDSIKGSALESEAKSIIDEFHGEQWVKNYLLPAQSDVDRIAQLQTPTLVFTGGKDMRDFIEIGEFLEQSSPYVTLNHYSNCGHLIPYEAPSAVAQDIRQFLSEV